MSVAFPTAEAHSDRGMGRIDRSGYETALLDLIAPWLEDRVVDVVICGMAGARQGWIEAAYRPVPCPPLGPGAARPDTVDRRLRVHVLPGLRQDAPPEVMRGEETRIAGLLAVRPDFDGVVCLPGTHTK